MTDPIGVAWAPTDTGAPPAIVRVCRAVTSGEIRFLAPDLAVEQPGRGGEVDHSSQFGNTRN